MIEYSKDQQALTNAKNSKSFVNYDAIFNGFMEMGIAPDAISPRENVYTFNAWKALGRIVSRGQHGVKVVTFVVGKKVADDGTYTTFKMPRTTTVFHVSQTEELK